MAIKIIAVIGLICCVCIGILFALYTKTANSIIESNEREIANLKEQLRREQQKEKVQVIDIQDGRNPKFGGF